MREVGLYIHVPFCKQKCHYCDFNSVSWQQEQGARFLAAVKTELKLLADKYSVSVATIFLGGGTPTILPPAELVSLLAVCREQFKTSSEPEITVEANPETVTKEQLKLFKQAGVNRLSFGVQSLNNFFLAKLGRRHTVKEVVDSYRLARKAGFTNLNLDLIFALPGQKKVDWRRTLHQVIDLAPEHLSCYNLKLESGTTMYDWARQGKLALPTEEQDLAMYHLTQDLLAEAGYHQYEISNFARSGFECEHNRIYWLNQPYLGVGPGAHFYDGMGRGYNYAQLDKYWCQLEAGNLPIAEYNKLTQEEQIEETMILGLRLTEGISLAGFKDRYGCSVTDIYEQELKELQQNNLIDVEENRIFLTKQGRVIANRVLAKFLIT